MIVECLVSHDAFVQSIDTLLMSNLIAFFAHRDIRDIVSQDQILLVHADLAHFSVIVAFLKDNNRVNIIHRKAFYLPNTSADASLAFDATP